MLEERIELVGGVDVANDVQKKIRSVGVRGLDINKAKEFGVFDRISNLLCVTHASITAANRIYGDIAYVLSIFGGRKNEIAREMNAFEKAYERFLNFWTDYYANGAAGDEIRRETETLYHKIMKWAQLPESWNLGDEQRLKDSTDIAIKIERDNDTDLFFHKTSVNKELLEDISESWCVTKFDVQSMKQITVNTDMDKASALMVAKRLSEEDHENIYTACMVQDVKERRLDVTPYKAFKENETVGNIKNVFR